MENTAIILTLSWLPVAVGIILAGINWLAVKRIGTHERKPLYCDDGTPPRFFITGDKHRDFTSVKRFCREMNTRRKDVLIILGDSGLNYYEDIRDDKLKAAIAELNITLLCLYGNKECRPENIGTYGVRTFCGGRVYYEPKYPNIFFATDGEVYSFDGRRYIVMDGAHSVDKQYCLEEGRPFWNDEMPDGEAKAKFEDKLAVEGNRIFGILTHTCPIGYLPTEMFLSAKQKAGHRRKPKRGQAEKQFKLDIDRSTEEWLGEIEKKTDYKVWYCGHYHIDKQIDKIYMMHREIRLLHGTAFGGTHE